MAKSPAFQFYAAEYLADENVQVMSLLQEGMYIRALAFCWREGSIPKDPKKFRALVGKTTGEQPSDDDVRVVQGWFNQHPTDEQRLVHGRLEKEREKQEKWREKSSAGGRKSAEKRAKKAESKGGSRVVQPNGNSSSSSSSSSSITPLPPKGVQEETGKPETVSAWTELKDFLIEHFHLTIVDHRGEKTLYADCNAFRALGAGVTEILAKEKAYRARFPGMPCTIKALLTHWRSLEVRDVASTPARANPAVEDLISELGL